MFVEAHSHIYAPSLQLVRSIPSQPEMGMLLQSLRPNRRFSENDACQNVHTSLPHLHVQLLSVWAAAATVHADD